MKDKFYITTAIAYTNSDPHVGFALEILQADVLARYHRQLGDNVFFLTGTDEHGKKIKQKAKDEGKDPREFVDEVSEKFKNLTLKLNISNNYFIRTSDAQVHYPVVSEIWKKLKSKGDIYKASYEALYCVGCEAFISEKELEDGKCKDHKKEPEKISEENYFFRLSKYKDRIKDAIKSDKINIVPSYRKKEILNLFESESVQDVSFSRPKESVEWGIDVPDDDSQKIYVWADALVNYISGLGGVDSEKFKKFWPADVHLIGKDILRFHAMIWPAMLLALDLELPKNIYVHGFITHDGVKMSKSLGNVVNPFDLVKKYGAEATRYYLLREIPSYSDGDFSYERFEERYGDLSNKLGNLVARVSAMAEKNSHLLDGLKIDQEKLSEDIKSNISAYKRAMENFELNIALENVFKILDFSDKLIEKTRLWELPKKDQKKFYETVKELALNMANVAYLLVPFLPETSKKIFGVLGIFEEKEKWKEQKISFKKPEPLFPRLED